MEEEKRYRLTYQVDQHPDGITEKELDERPGDHGACDAILLCSVLGKFGEGALSTMWMGIDGNPGKGDMTPLNMFQLWSILAANLSENLPDGPHQMIAQNAIDNVRALLAAARALRESDGQEN